MRGLSYIISLSCLLPTFLRASTPPPKQSSSQPFVEATRKAQPSVVSIKSKLKKQMSRSWTRDNDEMTPEDFWERFFGINPFEQRKKAQQPRFVFGSGFIVSNDGYILTNNHNVEQADVVTVQLANGKEYTATIIGTDPATDIALLKIDETSLPALSLAHIDDVEVGESVLAIGNPLGFQASVSAGIVSAKGRSDFDIMRVESFIQTDAAINPGNSGGPLINLNGDVVGMNTLIVVTNGAGGNIGIGFAVPCNFLKDVMQELIEHGQLIRGYLGVALQRVDSDIASALGLEKTCGALVSEVLPDSPAEKAGLESGDIILEVENTPIESAGNLRNIVALAKPGQEITLKVKRNNKTLTLTAQIGETPTDGTTKVEDSIGLVLEPVTKELAKKYHLETASGLLVVQIDPDSLAYQAGLRSGHVILAVNGNSVSTVQEFSQAVHKVKGKRCLLQIKIGPNIRFVPLEVE